MKVKQAMHSGVEWCAPDTPIREIARLMKEKDVGAIPIGENDRLVGMVTDRDITCRGVSKGGDLDKMKARDVMTQGIIYCTEDEDLEDAIHRMEERQVRRMPVLNAKKRMTGMLSLGDLSQRASYMLSGELIESVAAHH